MILPGATLGVLGGGQLGRMFAVAARTMGYHVVVLDPDPDSPAGRIADEHIRAAFENEQAVHELGARCSAVTTEFENVPAQTLEWLRAVVPTCPSAKALLTTQDRVREKGFLSALGLPTVPYRVVSHSADVDKALRELPGPYRLKRSALGYDGKGQVAVGEEGSVKAAFEALGGVPCVLEQQVNLQREVSVVVARTRGGVTARFPVARNRHEHGILSVSSVSGDDDEPLSAPCGRLAQTVAEGLDYCGVMAVEFFVTTSGDLLINEIAPRPHNSGHFTLDACVTSQFDQQVRMMCGLPPGETRLLSPVVMVNLMGELWTGGNPNWGSLLTHPGVRLYLYGKREPRPGRKMGHFCLLDPDISHAQATAERLLADLAPETTRGPEG